MILRPACDRMAAGSSMPPEENRDEDEPMEPAENTSDDVAVVEIRTTFPRREAATACAARIVGGRLAACVQIDGPITSLYRWQGEVEHAEEFRCTFKTTRGRCDECVAAIVAGHEYATPEVLVTTVTASNAYAAWVHGSVTPE